MVPERLVSFRVRTILTVLGLALAVAFLLEVVMVASQVLAWIFISLFLALALNPAVDWLQRHGLRSRLLATTVAFLGALAAIAGIGALFVPTLVDQVNDFVNALPGYVEDITQGRGPLGFLETEYQVVEKVRAAVEDGGASKLLGLSGTALAVTKGVITLIIATITIAFMTFFMLLEGPAWMERLFSLMSSESQPRWRRVGHDIYRTVGGYVAGNLLISLIAGVASAIVLLIMGVPYAIALGLIVALLDLIPLAGATIATVVMTAVAFIESVPAGIVVLVFFLVYQQVENHFLFPIVYSRTVQLSPLAVLIAVLLGAELAGILGALAAIPVAGTIQVFFLDWLGHRKARLTEGVTPAGSPAET